MKTPLNFGERLDWVLEKKETVPNFSNFTFASEQAVISSVYGKSVDLYAQDSNNTLRHAVYNYNLGSWKWDSIGKSIRIRW